jgi:hypothetical protein
MRRLLVIVAFSASGVSPALAQLPATLVPGARVRVSAPRHRALPLTGKLARFDRDSIWVVAAHQDSAWMLDEYGVWVRKSVGQPRDTLWGAPLGALTRLEVSRGKRTRMAAMGRGAARGFLYAGAFGAVLGTMVRDPEGFFYKDRAGGALFWGTVVGTLGGVTGALYGLAAPGERWQRLPVPPR